MKTPRKIKTWWPVEGYPEPFYVTDPVTHAILGGFKTVEDAKTFIENLPPGQNEGYWIHGKPGTVDDLGEQHEKGNRTLDTSANAGKDTQKTEKTDQ